MKGPFELSKLNIDKHIESETIGVYILSRGNNTAHYVGRSDTGLRTDLQRSVRDKKYVQFWFETAKSSLETYYLECEWYHKYNPRDNKNHPTVPPGATWKCPVPGCPWSS